MSAQLAAGPVSRRRPWSLLILVLIFALPPLLGWLYFLNPEWLPGGQKNHGVLVQPARSIQPLSLETVDGERFDWGELEGKWSIVLVAREACGDACIERLIQVRQLRRALAADRQRVERILIMDRAASPPSLSGLEGTRLLLVPPAFGANAAALFDVPGIPGGETTYLIDPTGGLMMAHDKSIPLKKMLEDLQTLLKASQNWARGGQYGHR